jgi:TIR domain/Protein of unknown function (DUF4231)/SMODS and SLOG-associating 2TM effector domain 1
MAGKIFINYRRGDDPGNTGRLFDRLQEAFQSEQLFMDVDSIAPGLDFVQVLEDQVGHCDVLIAVIGKGWLDVRDDTDARRLDSPKDFVRIEIESALKQHKRVIPVLVGDSRMPRPEELPEAIRPLAQRNAVRLTHERFRADAEGLIKALRRALEEAEALRQTQMTALTETADRQSIWSKTASVLKRRVEVARWRKFAFLILGTLLAAMASQFHEPERLLLALAGAVFLAASFTRSRRGLQITNWRRAHMASEALKREAYKYAACAKPYEDPLRRDGVLNVERERIESDVDDLVALAVSNLKAGSAPRAELSRDGYVASRVRAQIERADVNNKANNKTFVSLRWVESGLVLGAILTVMIGVAGKELFGIRLDFVALIPVLVIAVILAHNEATRRDFLVTIHRATARRLRAEVANIGAVNALSPQQWSDFVDRCEAIISDENASWAAA